MSSKRFISLGVTTLSILALLYFLNRSAITTAAAGSLADTLVVATINVEDLRVSDFEKEDHPRLDKLAEIIKTLDADILLVNEIAQEAGDDLHEWVNSIMEEEKVYMGYWPDSNTGIHSGFDLNNDGIVSPDFPTPANSDSLGNPPRQNQEQRDYGNDTWGFGTFPGQYSMYLLYRAPLNISTNRSFMKFLWSDMPGALAPGNPETKEEFYSEEEWAAFPLSSKSHEDFGLVFPSGKKLNILFSHPTPPAFDGPEMRNKKRNHDEIRFWADYLNGAEYIYDKQGQKGGYASDAPYILLGDQNADPDEGSSFDNPAKKFLMNSGLFNTSFTPRADAQIRDLDPDDTSQFGLRVDYVLPSTDIEIIDGGVLASPSASGEGPSDHFPVWIRIVL